MKRLVALAFLYLLLVLFVKFNLTKNFIEKLERNILNDVCGFEHLGEIC